MDKYLNISLIKRGIGPTSFCLFLVWLKPLGTSASDWFQIFSALAVAYSITIVVNNYGSKKQLMLTLTNEIENYINDIEKQFATRNVGINDVRYRFIPLTRNITTRVTYFDGELRSHQTELKKQIEIFTDEIRKLREYVSGLVEKSDEIKEGSREINEILCRVDRSRTSLWKIRFKLFS